MKFKISLFLLFIFSFLIFNLATLAHGQSPTPTPEEKIKGIREAVKEKVRAKLAETQKGQKRAFVGKIAEITNSTLILETRLGEKQVKVATDTAILDNKRRKTKLENLGIDNFVIVMGYWGENEILEARRVVVTAEPQRSIREVVFGEVTDISEEEKVLTVKNKKKNLVYTIEVTKKTKLTKKLKFSDIKKSDRLIVVGIPSEEEEKIIAAKLIHVIPTHAVGLESPSPSPEISPTPTPETSPTP